MDAGGEDRVSFLGRPPPAAFRLRALVIRPGGTHAFDAAEWRDALVVVERGTVDLLGAGGGRHGLVAGDVVCLEGLALRALRNLGDEAALVVAVSRRGAPRPAAGPR